MIQWIIISIIIMKFSETCVLATFTAILALISSFDAKKYNKCELARELVEVHRLAVTRAELRKWLCLIFWESNYNTSALHTENGDSSSDHGLFQINDRYWCDPEDGRQSANVCQIKCKGNPSD